MVGVPGRSKGCNTCIQRKIKCDGGQPACDKCKKSNRLCTGYRRAVAFVISENVALGAAPVEDTEGATITTQGRWRRRARKTPKARDIDPELMPNELAAKAGLKAAAAAAAGRSDRTNDDMPARAIDSVDLSTTASDADIKRTWKQYIYTNDEDAEENQVEGQLVLSKRRARTAEALSQVIGNLRSTANVAMLDFATPVSAGEAIGGLDGPLAAWSRIGSPMVQHVSSDAVWREQLFPMFLGFHLPNDLIYSCKTTTKTLRSRNWLLNLSDTSLEGSPALETGMAALCMSRVGRKHNNMTLVQHSLRLYTEGLGQLQDAITDPSTQLTDQTLAACMAFSMYEVAECPSRRIDGYYSHHSGGLALLKMRGPDAHISPLGHSLFVFMRTQQFIYALLRRKANFLSDAEWVNRPWQTAAKDPQDKFMDQMYCIPVLLEQADKLEESNADTDTMIRGFWDIIVQYHVIHTCLEGWFRDLQSIVAGPLYWPELSKMKFPVYDDTGKGRPFPVAFHFPAFSIGQSMMLFWLISTMINFQLAKLYRQLVQLKMKSEASYSNAPPGADPFDVTSFPTADINSHAVRRLESTSPAPSSPKSPSATPDSTTSSAESDPAIHLTDYPPSIPIMVAAANEAEAISRNVSDKICQSVEYFLQDVMGDIGPLSMMLPLTTLRHILIRTAPVKPCPKGRPGLPGEFKDETIWVDTLLQFIGNGGQQLCFFLEEDY